MQTFGNMVNLKKSTEAAGEMTNDHTLMIKQQLSRKSTKGSKDVVVQTSRRSKIHTDIIQENSNSQKVLQGSTIKEVTLDHIDNRDELSIQKRNYGIQIIPKN